MPLVRIDVIENRRTPDRLRDLADIVQGVMADVFKAPHDDRYQVITEHRRGQIIAEDSGLGFRRSDDIVLIEVTQQGRDESHKRSMYRLLAERLEEHMGLAGDDLIVCVVANGRDDWSFGRGQAQFLDGSL